MFYKDKIVLVTGGSGFVGTHLVIELLKAGAKVRVPIHKKPLVVQDKRIETIKADLNKDADCMLVAKNVDYIFHAAGPVGSAAITGDHAMSAITTTLSLTAQMLKAAMNTQVKGFLVFSSSTGYPASNTPVKEEEFWCGPTHPSYFGYGWMRRYLERLAEFAGSKSKMKIAIVRPCAVYGPWDNFDLSSCHVIPALIKKAIEKLDPYEVWGSGEEVRDFLHVSDLARGCLSVMEKGKSCDPINIASGKAVKINEIVNIILRATQYEKAKIVFNNSKPTNIPIRMMDTKKAKDLLRFEPQISLEKGLFDTVKWYLHDYHKN